MNSKITPMIIFIPDRNHIKKDFEFVFLPEAEKFREYVFNNLIDDSDADLINIYKVNISKRANVYGIMFIVSTIVKEFFLRHEKIKSIVFICHGYRSGIQLGIRKTNYKEFLDIVYPYINTDANFIFYSCNVANGFLYYFNQYLIKQGFMGHKVIGHTNRGHAIQNPFVKVYSDIYPNGEWIIQPNIKEFKIWKEILKTDFKYKYPFMDIVDIRNHVKDVYVNNSLTPTNNKK